MSIEETLDRLEHLCTDDQLDAPPPAATVCPLPPIDLSGVHPSVAEAHQATRRWVGDILHERKPPYWLTLYGNCGCGKTLLASHARHHLGTLGSRVELRNWPRVLDSIYNKDEGLLNQMMTIPILILDDVGAEYTASQKTSRFSASKLYLLAEARLGKWTFITSNLDYNAMKQEIGHRFASRVYRNSAAVVDMSQAADYSYEQWRKRRRQNA